MIGPFPGRWLVLEGKQLDPLQPVEVQHADGIEALFIESSASEEHELLVVRVVVEGGIGPRRRRVS